MKKFLLLLFVVASYTMNAQSTFYVATTGSNSNSGTSSSPFLTIQKAVDVASNGVKGVVIIDGRKNHSILFELLSDKGSGTLIRQ